MIVIAIDPDCEKSGVAVLDSDTRVFFQVESLNFPNLMILLSYWREHAKDIGLGLRVVVEAGYLNESNWHIANAKSIAMAAKIGNATGRNHETARKIVEMARYMYGLQTTEVKPLRKIWHGKDRKITHDELVRVTGLQNKKTNQDERDACILAWVYAGLPIKL